MKTIEHEAQSLLGRGKKTESSAVTGAVSHAEKVAKLLQQIDLAIKARKPRTPFINDEQRYQLRTLSAKILAQPENSVASDDLRHICKSQSYLAVAGNFVDFCTGFLSLPESLANTVLQEIADQKVDDSFPTCADLPNAFQRMGDRPALASSSKESPVEQTAMVSSVVREPVPNHEGLEASLSLIPMDTANEETPEYWISRINFPLHKSAECFVAAGVELLAAKAKLPHGQFEQLFDSGKLHIDQRTAQKLMRIANHPVLAKANNYSFLPPTLNSLSVLAGLDEGCLEKAITRKKISPEMTIAEIRALVAQMRKPTQPKKTDLQRAELKELPGAQYGQTDYKTSGRLICDLLVQEFAKCPDERWRTRLCEKVKAHLKALNKPF